MSDVVRQGLAYWKALFDDNLITNELYISKMKEVVGSGAPSSASRCTSDPEPASPASASERPAHTPGDSPPRKKQSTTEKKQTSIVFALSGGSFVKHHVKDGKCVGSTVNRLDAKFVDEKETPKKRYSCRQGCGFKTGHPPALASHEKTCFYVSCLDDLDDELEALEQDLLTGKAMQGSADKHISMSTLTHQALGIPQPQHAATERQEATSWPASQLCSLTGQLPRPESSAGLLK